MEITTATEEVSLHVGGWVFADGVFFNWEDLEDTQRADLERLHDQLQQITREASGIIRGIEGKLLAA